MADANSRAGLLSQLRHWLDAGLALVQVRLALAGTEIELEKQRLLNGFFWGVAALISLTLAAVLFCGFVILLLWDGYRLAALGTLALFFLAGGAWLLGLSRRKLRSKSSLFSASLAELDRDRAALLPAAANEPR